MDSAENTQEVVNNNRADAGTTAEASNKILSMWDSEEQATSEVADTPVDEEVVEETEEAEEVEEEDDEHQFFYTVGSGLAAQTEYANFDGDGNPLGTVFILTTGAASSGSLTFTLRHEPNKTASGVNEGDISNAGGSTDIEVTFALVVE